MKVCHLTVRLAVETVSETVSELAKHKFSSVDLHGLSIETVQSISSVMFTTTPRHYRKTNEVGFQGFKVAL